MDPIVTPPPTPHLPQLSTRKHSNLGGECSPSKVFPSEKPELYLEPRRVSQGRKLLPRAQDPPTHPATPPRIVSGPRPASERRSEASSPPLRKAHLKTRSGATATAPCSPRSPPAAAADRPTGRPAEQPSSRAAQRPVDSPRPARAPSSLACLAPRSPPPGDSSRGRPGPGRRRRRSLARRRSPRRPRAAHAPLGGPHTCGAAAAAAKLPRAASAGAPVRSGRTRSSSLARPRSTYPAPPRLELSRGGEGTGRGGAPVGCRTPPPSLHAPLSPPPPPRPPPGPLAPLVPGPPHPRNLASFRGPPQSLYPLNFPPRWRPWSWPGRAPT